MALRKLKGTGKLWKYIKYFFGLIHLKISIIESTPCRAVGRANRGGRSLGIPIRAANDDGLATDIMTSEAEVGGAERAVSFEEIANVACDANVEANVVARDAADVVSEQTNAGVELRKSDSLCLNFAHLFRDDPLSHLLDDKETLLDDFYGFRVADEFLVLFDHSLFRDGANEIIHAIEVVEAGKRGKSTPVIK